MQRGVCSSSKFVAWPQGHQSKLLMSSYHSDTLIKKGPWVSQCRPSLLWAQAQAYAQLSKLGMDL